MPWVGDRRSNHPGGLEKGTSPGSETPGTSSSGRPTNEETQFAYELDAGFDDPLGNEVSQDVRARSMASDESAGRIVWDPLRSHLPNLPRHRSEPVDGATSTE